MALRLALEFSLARYSFLSLSSQVYLQVRMCPSSWRWCPRDARLNSDWFTSTATTTTTTTTTITTTIITVFYTTNITVFYN